jgi:hypothetical protein
MEAVLVPWHVDGATWNLLLVDLPSDVRIARGSPPAPPAGSAGEQRSAT